VRWKATPCAPWGKISQALIAIYDNGNSLHTNAFDDAITTPTEDS
jgi:methylmalonyl-CoA mutase N-terminal domain/subunit